MFILFFSLAHAQPEILPIDRVRLYETGVAWVERKGTVERTTTLPVPRGQLDDALKTLVLLGGEVTVDAITFPSSLGDAHARALAGLHEGEPTGFAQATKTLLGVEVAVEKTDGELARGTLLDLEGPLPRAASKEGTGQVQPSQYALTLLGSNGTLQRIFTEEIKEIRTKAPQVTQRLQQAASTLTKAAARQRNELRVDLTAGGTLALGYLMEAPVWRATYRMVLSDQEQASLQGWGIVHNDTDEDWEDISLELANGEPDSFLYPMAAPRYAPRELVTPKKALSAVPQLATTTPDSMWDESNSLHSIGGGIGGAGFGMGGGGGILGAAGGHVLRPAKLQAAQPIKTPTQFVYRVPRRLSLPAHHSGLVPIIQEEVSADPRIIFTPGNDQARLGMWVQNDTSKTLPAGVVSVYASGGLAGETAIRRLESGSAQMVQFGNELDVDLEIHPQPNTSTDTELSFLDGVFQIRSQRERTLDMNVSNRSGRERTLAYAMELTAYDTLDAQYATHIDPETRWTYVDLPAAPGDSSHPLTIQSVHIRKAPAETTSSEQYRAWATAGLGDAATLKKAADLRARIASLDATLASKDRQAQATQKKIDALRKDLRSAEGSSGAGALSRRVASAEQEAHQLGEQRARAQARRVETIESLHLLLSTLKALPSAHPQQAAR